MPQPLEKSSSKLILRLDEIAASFPQSFSKSYYKSFHINRIEDFRPVVEFSQPYRKVVHDMLFLTKGTTIRTKGLDKRTIEAGTIFIVPAYQIRTIEFISDDIEGYFCHFDLEIFDKKLFPAELFKVFSFLQYTGEPMIEIPLEFRTEIVHIFERLLKDYTLDPPPNFNLACSYLLTLFFELNRLTGLLHKPKNTNELLTQRYQDALMNHVYDMQHVADFADLFKVSPGYLNRCVKKTTGKTAHQLLLEIQMLEAKFLLRQSELSISEIAFKIAGKNHSDFSRSFKSYSGLSPKEFRNNLKIVHQ